MSFSDLKIFLVIAVIGIGGYALLFSNGAWKRYQHGAPAPRKNPEIIFVKPGTPGAKTWDEYQAERFPRYRKR